MTGDNDRQLHPEQNRPAPWLLYRHQGGEIDVGDAVAWLRMLPDETADLMFTDSPYNPNKTAWDRFPPSEENGNIVRLRVLRNSG